MRRLLVPALAALLLHQPVMGADATVAPTVPAASAQAVIDPAQPESAVLLPAQVLKANDFKAFFLSLPVSEQDKARADWTAAQQAAQQPGAAADQAEFNAFLGRLLAPTAVEDLLAEAAPQLAQINPQEASQGLQMMGGFLPMMLQANQQPGAQDPAAQARLTAIVALLQGICTDASQWVLTAGLNDKAKLKEALTHLVAGAKALGVKDAAELQALPLEEFLARLTPLVQEAKLALAVYGIEVDAFLSSVTATVEPAAAGAKPDERTLVVGLTLFGKPYRLPVVVQRSGQHWVISPTNGAPLAPMMGGQEPAGAVGPGMPLEAPVAEPAPAPAAPVTP